MSRKGKTEKRDVLPDPVYNSKLVTRLINRVMFDGKRGTSQTIPLLCSLPGAVVFLIWFFGRKSYVENVQKIDDGAFKFALFLVLAICADLAVGVIGLVVISFKYITAGIVAYAVSVGLQVVFCLLAFVLCPPYSRH